MTTVGNSYVMFGGLYVPSDPKKPATNAIPTDEVYTLRIGLSKILNQISFTAFKLPPFRDLKNG